MQENYLQGFQGTMQGAPAPHQQSTHTAAIKKAKYECTIKIVAGAAAAAAHT
jgi:hypothetical protein